MDVNNADGCDKENYCLSSIELQKILKTSVDNLLKSASEEKFVHTYKNCYKKFEKKDDVDRPRLCGSSVEAKKYRTLFNEIMKNSLCETIDETVFNMNKKLKELEIIKRDQANNSIFWRPPGNASKHYIPFEYACQLEKKRELEEKIKKEKEALHILKSRLQQKRNKANDLHKQLLLSINAIRDVACNIIDDSEKTNI